MIGTELHGFIFEDVFQTNGQNTFSRSESNFRLYNAVTMEVSHRGAAISLVTDSAFLYTTSSSGALYVTDSYVFKEPSSR